MRDKAKILKEIQSSRPDLSIQKAILEVLLEIREILDKSARYD